MPTVTAMPYAKIQFFDSNGDPLNGGKLFAYVAGSSTKQDTYTSAAGSSTNTNPVVLDSAGRANVFLDVTQSYKLVLTTSTDTDPPVSPIWSADNITAVPASMTIIPTGLVVGFSGSVLADAIQLGDATNVYDYNSGNPQWQVDTGDWVRYTRATNTWTWSIAATDEMTFDASGLQITNGLVVGYAATPTDDQVRIGDSNFRVGPSMGGANMAGVLMDSTDFLQYNRTSNQYDFYVANTSAVTISGAGMAIADSLFVGNNIPTGETNTVWVGDANFGLNYTGGTTPALVFDTSDFILFTRATNTYTFDAGAATRLSLSATKLIVAADGTSDVQWGKALVALGGGAAPTLGTIGGSGPATAGQNTWLRLLDSAGNACWVPVWK